MKLRTTDPWLPAPDYGHSLKGLTLNLIVSNLEKALLFQREVLGAEVLYSDPDFAILQGYGAEWMLHADHTYDTHPIRGSLAQEIQRGAGAEFRLHGCDPDTAEMAARRLGFEVLAGASDKPHGLREVYLLDGDGYIWVPDIHRRSD